jgi:uncharacterized protein YndB with AHSA1/START domain
MLKVESSVVISKPVDEVFAYVTNGDNATKWQVGVESAVQEAPVDLVGSRYLEVRRFMGQELKTTLEVTVVERPSKWAAKVVEGPIPYELQLAFEAQGGATKVTIGIEGEPTGVFKLASGMLEGQLDKNIRDNCEKLKATLEK